MHKMSTAGTCFSRGLCTDMAAPQQIMLWLLHSSHLGQARSNAVHADVLRRIRGSSTEGEAYNISCCSHC